MIVFYFLCVLMSLLGNCSGVVFDPCILKSQNKNCPGAVFDPYCRRYDLQKSTMSMLLLKQNGTTVFTKSLIAIAQTSTISEPKKSALIEDFKDLDLVITSTDTVINFIEYVKELWRIQYLYHPDLVDFFQTLRFKNLSTWGPLENVYGITDQYYILGSPNSGVDSIWSTIKTQTASGFCQLYDSLITAASNFETGNAEVLAYLQASYSPEMCRVTENTMLLWFKMCEVDIPAGIIKAFLHDQLIGGFFYFNEFCRASAAYRKLDIYDKYFAIPDPLLVRTMNMSVFSSQAANFSATQKAFIKQTQGYFAQQFPLLSTIPARQDLLVKKFSEALDLSISYFQTFNYVQMEKYDGNFYEMIRHICQRTLLTSKFNDSIISSNTTAPSCSPNGTITTPQPPTLIPPTQTPVIPFSCSATQKFAAMWVAHDVIPYNQGYGKADFAGICNSTRTGGAWIYMDGLTPAFVTPDGVSAAASILHNVPVGVDTPCPYLCICSPTGSCYVVAPTTTSSNPEIVLYPHCEVNSAACYFVAFLSTPGAMRPYNNVGQTYTDALQYDANGARLPITDPSYVRVKSVSCHGCPITIE